ncbi:MAG: 6-phosphogluconolactonase [Spirochaetes bacterium]|nr:6-phosphogluconolactonase [Spirochaetota bacterium]
MDQIKIFNDKNAIAQFIADELIHYSNKNKPIHISLSGGSTPLAIFEVLAKESYFSQINWLNLHFWWGDERCVAPENEESNYGTAYRTFLHELPDQKNIHRIFGENNPEEEVKRLINEMQGWISLEDHVPVFDWIILGMGEDGHTASLFPDGIPLDHPSLAAIATHPQTGQKRITLTANVLRKGLRISYLVTGTNKQDILKDILNKEKTNNCYPAAQIKSLKGTTEWILDKAAALKINNI